MKFAVLVLLLLASQSSFARGGHGHYHFATGIKMPKFENTASPRMMPSNAKLSRRLERQDVVNPRNQAMTVEQIIAQHDAGKF